MLGAFFGSAVYETTTTTGTGTLDLAGAVSGWGAFGDGDLTSPAKVAYWILDADQKPLECGFGTWTSGSPDTLSRDTVVGPGGISTPVSLAAGTKYVTCAPLHSQLNGQDWVDVASAGTTDIGNQTSPFINITGTTTITALGTSKAGFPLVTVKFAGALTLTHNGTSLILPSGANIAAALGDIAVFKHEGSGNWRCLAYTRADGTAVAGSSSAVAKSSSFTIAAADRGKTFLVDASGGPVTASLPAAASAGSGFEVTLVPTGNTLNATTLDGDASETIDGVTTRATNMRYQPVTVVCDGAGWYTKGGFWGYESAEQSLTAGGVLSLTHNLGLRPKDVELELVCKVADLNYSVGERVLVPPATVSGVGAAVKTSSSTIGIQFGAGSGGSVFILLDDSGGSSNTITNSSWRLVVRARA